MRKEVTIYLDTTEKEVEFNLRRDIFKPDNVLLTFEGVKFSFSPKEMIEALKALDEFYSLGTCSVSETKMIESQMFPTHEEDV